jgi:hypothetical protein
MYPRRVSHDSHPRQASVWLIKVRLPRQQARVAEQTGWRVRPELPAAVKQVVRDCHAERAPLYPLPEIQRLGYLDEEDTIECRKDLAGQSGRVVFRKGQRDPLRTQTVSTTRKVERPNTFTGQMEDLNVSIARD